MESTSSAPAAVSESAPASVPAPEDDFAPRIGAEFAEIADETEVDNTRAVALYDAGSMFECALAATFKCATVAALSGESIDYDAIRAKLVETKPHTVIFLNNKWPMEFCASFARDDAPTPSIVVILTPTKPEERAESLPDNLLFMSPRLFIRFAPVMKVVSAQLIFAHLMNSEFPGEFRDHESAIREGQLFKIALRAQTNSTLEAWTFVREIVTDWHKVYEPDELVAFGRVLTTVGAKMARARSETHSAIVAGLGGCDIVRVIESHDYVDAMLAAALANPKPAVSAAVVYSMSANTERVLVHCTAATGDIARAVCADLIGEGGEMVMMTDTIARASCAADVFFAKIRATLVRAKITPEIVEAVVAGEKVLAGCGKLPEADK